MAGLKVVKQWRDLKVGQSRQIAHGLIRKYSEYAPYGGTPSYCVQSEEESRSKLPLISKDLPDDHLEYQCLTGADHWKIWIETGHILLNMRDVEVWLENDRVVRIETRAYFHIDL